MPWKRPRADAAPMAADTGALLAKVAAGDTQALDRLYRREAGPVYRYALALCGNPAWSADATQDAFIALAARPAGFDPGRGLLGAYLAGIARNTLRSLWRETQGHTPLDVDLDLDADETGAGVAESPETLLVRAQTGAAVWQALRALPAPFREALVLVDLQERAYAEAAQVAGITINTLRTRLHRARLRLAALLGAVDGALP